MRSIDLCGRTTEKSGGTFGLGPDVVHRRLAPGAGPVPVYLGADAPAVAWAQPGLNNIFAHQVGIFNRAHVLKVVPATVNGPVNVHHGAGPGVQLRRLGRTINILPITRRGDSAGAPAFTVARTGVIGPFKSLGAALTDRVARLVAEENCFTMASNFDLPGARAT